MRGNNAICIPIEELMLCLVFSIVRIITLLFYLALSHLPKLKRGQGQTSVLLLAIEFLKTLYLKSSLQLVLGPTLLTLHSWTNFH